MSGREVLFVQCGPGLESALELELARLGHRGAAVQGGVELDAPVGTYEALNLSSRVANRVLLRLGTLSRLESLRELPFSAYARAFQIEASGEGATRWVDAVRKVVRVGEGSESALLLLRVHGAQCTLSVDTTGELLHFRGYRQEIGRAPMRETLAAGLLELARWAPGEPLWDPMCGSGTVLIEAAERVAGLAPGRHRHFAFERFACHDAERFARRPRTGLAHPTTLIGTDLNAGALGTARRNARRADVQALISLERADATTLRPRAGVAPGLFLANLPYGKRVGERSELGSLYRAFGQALRRFSGWRFALFLEEGAEHLGLHIESSMAVSNGGLRCSLVVGRLSDS